MAPRWPIYRLEGGAAAVARLKARVGLDPRERELPCDPGASRSGWTSRTGPSRRSRPCPGPTRPRSRSGGAASTTPASAHRIEGEADPLLVVKGAEGAGADPRP